MTTTVPGFSSKTFLLLAFAVAASSIVGSATAATLGLDDEVYHRGRLGDVTGDNGPSIREQMHRRMKHRSVKAPTCPSKVSFSGSKSKSDRGDKCTAPIACGDVIDGETTLTSNLICPERFTGTALTLMGSGAVLNCNGFGILRTQGDYDSISDGTGLSLEGGATAVNCAVRGWNVGVTMNEGSNTLADSIIERNKIGVKIESLQESDCATVANVRSSYNGGDGFDIRGQGTVVINDSAATLNNDDGIDIQGGSPRVVIVDSALDDNSESGLHDSIGEVPQVELYGKTSFSRNNDYGIVVRDGIIEFVSGVFNANDNSEHGIFVLGNGGFVTFGSSNLVKFTACNNFETDLNGNSIGDLTFVDGNGDLTCETLDGVAVTSGLVCKNDCSTTC